MKAFFMENWLMLLAAVVLFGAIVSAYLANCSVRNGKIHGRSAEVLAKRMVWRGLSLALAASMIFSLFVGCQAGPKEGDQSADPGSSQGDGSGDGSEEEPPEMPPVEPLPDVNLSQKQYEEFVQKYGLKLAFDDSSLADKAQDRVEAYKLSGYSLTDGIAYPYLEALEDVKTIGKLTGIQKVELFLRWRTTIYQEIVSNPVIGMAWAEMLNESELVTENNAWLPANLEIIDKIWAGTYVQPKSTDPDYAKLMQIDLNSIPVPTDVTCKGLDYFLVYNGGTIEVRQAWARFAVKICAVLEYFEISGVTNRTSTLNFRLPPISENALVRAEKAPYQEDKPSIILRYMGKDDREGIVYGSNMIDRRPMEFKPNSKEPTKVPSGDPETPPPTTTQPKTKYGKVVIHYVDQNGAQMPGMADKTSGTLVVGKPYSIESYPAPSGMKLADSNQSTVSGKIVKEGTEDIYVKYIPVDKQVASLVIRYVDEWGTLLTGTSPNPYTESVEVNGTFSRKSPVIPGMALKDQSQSVVSSNRYGKMPATGLTIDVVYVQAKQQECLVTVSYVYETGGNVYPSKSYTLKLGDGYDEVGKDAPRNYYFEPDGGYHGKITQSDVDRGYLNLTFTYFYKPFEAWKDKSKDPVNNNNADGGGGSNLSGDGTGTHQPDEPKRAEYPAQGSSTEGIVSTRPDYNDKTGNSTETLPAGNDQKHESSGQGNGSLDHTIVDPNGGHTDNGTPAEKTPIEVDKGTTATDNVTGQTTTVGQEQTNHSSIAEPD